MSGDRISANDLVERFEKKEEKERYSRQHSVASRSQESQQGLKEELQARQDALAKELKEHARKIEELKAQKQQQKGDNKGLMQWTPTGGQTIPANTDCSITTTV